MERQLMNRKDRFEISLIDFQEGIFQKITTSSVEDEFLIKTSDNSIRKLGDYLPGLMTITGDLSSISDPRDQLVKKALEEYLMNIDKIYGRKI